MNYLFGQSHMQGAKSHIIKNRRGEKLIIRVLENQPDHRPNNGQVFLINDHPSD